MGERDLAAKNEAAREEKYEELRDEDLIEVGDDKYPPYDGEKETTGVRKIKEIRKEADSENIKAVLDLSEKIETFTKAVESSEGRKKDILKDQLGKLLEQRKEATSKLNDNEAVRVGFGQQRAEELRVNVNGSLQEYQKGDLNEADKAVLEGKIENIIGRMKKIIDGFGEEQKEKFTTNLSVGQVKVLGLERQAIRRLDKSIEVYNSILKKGRPADRKGVIANRNRLREERKTIWNGMSEEEKRQKYGIKTEEEFLAEQEEGKDRAA